jgi:hypothetical protein
MENLLFSFQKINLEKKISLSHHEDCEFCIILDSVKFLGCFAIQILNSRFLI